MDALTTPRDNPEMKHLTAPRFARLSRAPILATSPQLSSAMSLRYLIIPLLFAIGITAARAQDDAICRNGLFADAPPFALARIGGKEPAFFQSDSDGCPWRGAECRTRSYVVPGDVVIINRTREGYVCAFYPSPGGGSAGWLASRQVELLPNPTNPPRSQWQGDWSSEGNPTLSIRRDGAALRVTGQAFWPSPVPSENYPSVNIGTVDGTIEPAGQRAHYADDSLCEVDFTLLGEFLIAGDNRQCGGLNVTFSGVYHRVR